MERDALHLYLSLTDLLGRHHEHRPEDLLSQIPVLARAPPTDVAGAEHLIGHDPGVFDPFAGLPRIQGHCDVKAAPDAREPSPTGQVPE